MPCSRSGKAFRKGVGVNSFPALQTVANLKGRQEE